MISIAIGTLIALAAVMFVVRPLVPASNPDKGPKADEGSADSP